MNSNYRNVEKRIWTDKYIDEHYAYDKNNTGYVNVEILYTIDQASL